jgi:hypothetical protein
MLNLKILQSIIDGKHLNTISNDMDSDEVEEEFKCPRCGSSYFSHYYTDYNCYDEFNHGCTWHGPDEECIYYTSSKETLAQELISLLEEKE